jgi:xanthine dehydrogenase accessory factor
MDPTVLNTLNAERRARRAAILVTDLGDGSSRIVRESDTVAGGLARRRGRRFARGVRGDRGSDGRTLFLNVHICRHRASSSIGAVHISQALAPMARSPASMSKSSIRAPLSPHRSGFLKSICMPSGRRMCWR